MIKQVAEASPRGKARLAGLFYLLNILTGMFALVFVRGRLVAYSDAAATAANILAHKSMFYLGFAVDLVAVACYIAVTGLFYILFKPVNRSLSLLAAFFGLAGCAIQAFSSLFHLAPLVVLGGAPGGAPYLSVFDVEQLQALALASLKLQAQAFNICLVFFGFYCLLIGWLIFRSTFLPRILGALMVLASLGWLTFLFPPLASSLYPFNLAPGLIGEGLLTLWLLVIGVNAKRWQEQASAAGPH